MTADLHLDAAISAFVTAINTANIKDFVNSFTPDGVVNDWGTEYQGADGVHRWGLSDAIGANAQIEILTAKQEGNVTTTTFSWVSKVFTGESTGIFTVADGKIASFVIPPNH